MFGATKQGEDSDTNGFFQRLRQGLNKTRAGLLSDLGGLVSGAQAIDPAQLEEIESRLLMVDLGIESTTHIMDVLARETKSNRLNSFDEIIACLREQMIEILTPVQAPIEETFVIKKPFVVLVVGVNGVGKTTTIGKLAKYFANSGDKVMLLYKSAFFKQKSRRSQVSASQPRGAIHIIK